MSKKLKIYQVLSFALGIAFVVLCAYMGITAIQKSMKLKIGFEVKPSFECRIDYGGNTIFCNSTKDPNGTFVGNGFTLDGNTLSFDQSFEGIGETFVLTIYNYSDVSIKISVSGTNASGGPLTLAAYENSAPSDELTLVTTGASEAVLTFEEYTRPPYTIYQYGDTANGAVVAPNDGWEGYSYVVFDEATTYNGYDLRWIIIGAGTNFSKQYMPTNAPTTAYAGENGTNTELGANEVLLLSEKTLLNDEFRHAGYSALWKNSDLKTFLNGTFLTETGLSEYAASKALKTTSRDEATGDETTDQIFLLAYGSIDSAQSFCMETYLGSFTSGDASSNPRMFLFNGASASDWYLRSGEYDANYYAYRVKGYGYGGSYVGICGVNGSLGIRPSFVLNLA